MDTMFSAEMTVVRSPAQSTTKSLIQIYAIEDMDSLVPYLSFAGISPTDPKFLVRIVRGMAEWSAATAVTPNAWNTLASNHAARLAAAMRAWETNGSPPAEPSDSGAKILHSFLVHPQGGWVSPFAFQLKATETLTIRVEVPATAQNVLAGFRGRIA